MELILLFKIQMNSPLSLRLWNSFHQMHEGVSWRILEASSCLSCHLLCVTAGLPSVQHNPGLSGNIKKENTIALRMLTISLEKQFLWPVSMQFQGTFSERLGGAVLSSPHALPGQDGRRSLSALCKVPLSSDNLEDLTYRAPSSFGVHKDFHGVQLG